MTDPTPFIDQLSAWLGAANGTLGLFRGVRDELKRSGATDTAPVDRKIEEAEKALSDSDSLLAKALGYHLCQCTMPPQIMLLAGRHPSRGDKIFKCPRCGDQEPSQHYFDGLDREDQIVRELNGPNNWMG